MAITTKKKLKKKKPRMNNPKLKILKLEKKMEIFLKFYGIPWSDQRKKTHQ